MEYVILYFALAAVLFALADELKGHEHDQSMR